VKGDYQMDYATQCLLEVLTKSLNEISSAIRDVNDQLDRLNDTMDSITGSFQGRSHLNVVASVYES
jgi:prefoldin subunit 5